MITPSLPSTINISLGLQTFVINSVPTTAGTPKARAMIAVCEFFPPTFVQKPKICL